MDTILAIALILVSSYANAGLFKCTTKDGRIIYSDTPCAVARQEKLEYKDDTPDWQSQRNANERLRIDAAINHHRVVMGMSKADLIKSWGRPDTINKTIGAWGKHEQWVYENSNASSSYVYLENGVVTSLQISE